MSSQVDLSQEPGLHQFSVERDVILRTAAVMLQNAQDVTRRDLSRRAGMSVVTVVKHFKCRTDLMAEIEALGLLS